MARVLWKHSGIFVRGEWAGYDDALRRIIGAHPRLMLSLTVDVLRQLRAPGCGLGEGGAQPLAC
eukprot:SAG11_NODE_58_length_19205_cov_30.697315_11_plen_64_part_00